MFKKKKETVNLPREEANIRIVIGNVGVPTGDDYWSAIVYDRNIAVVRLTGSFKWLVTRNAKKAKRAYLEDNICFSN